MSRGLPEIRARFAGRCECGAWFKAGATVRYDPSIRRVRFCAACVPWRRGDRRNVEIPGLGPVLLDWWIDREDRPTRVRITRWTAESMGREWITLTWRARDGVPTWDIDGSVGPEVYSIQGWVDCWRRWYGDADPTVAP